MTGVSADGHIHLFLLIQIKVKKEKSGKQEKKEINKLGN